MTKREHLQEQYEDALFALLMDDLATSEGQKALEESERLKKDPNAAVPSSVDKQCLKQISKYYRKKALHSAGRTASRLVSNVAVVMLIVSVCFTTAFAASPTFRANTLNFIIDVFDDRSVLRLSAKNSDEGNSGDIEYTLVPEWLPEGCGFKNSKSNRHRAAKVYETDDGMEIEISAVIGAGTVLTVDTEDAATELLEIQGEQALLSKKNGLIQITWANKSADVFLEVQGPETLQNELIQIAENINIK